MLNRYSLLTLYFVAIMSCSTNGLAQTASLSDAPIIYTFGDQVDYTKEASVNAKKGASVLLWEKRGEEGTLAEIEISREDSPLKPFVFYSETHFFHTMVYFDKTYRWRVRYLDSKRQPVSEYSLKTPFRVLRKNGRVSQTTLDLVTKDPTLNRDEKTGELIKSLKVQARSESEPFQVMTPQPSSVRQAIVIQRKVQEAISAKPQRQVSSVPSGQSVTDQSSSLSNSTINDPGASQKPSFGELFVEQADPKDDGDFNY